MSQRYNDNTKTPKPKENWLGNSKIYTFCQKIQERASGIPGESTAEVTYLSMRKHRMLPQLYLVVQGRAQLEHSCHIVKVGVKATC